MWVCTCGSIEAPSEAARCVSIVELPLVEPSRALTIFHHQLASQQAAHHSLSCHLLRGVYDVEQKGKPARAPPASCYAAEVALVHSAWLCTVVLHWQRSLGVQVLD